MSKSKPQTTTHTIVRTRTEADVALRQAHLTAEEEKVLRMKYGIPLDMAVALDAPGLQTEARAQLESLEQRALAGVQIQAQGGVDSRGSVDSLRRAAIIERMRKM